MLFNSYHFVFIFLPLTLAGFALLGRLARPRFALTWLIVASIAFYAWWKPLNILIITPSILVNFCLARGILKAGDEHPRTALMLLLLGISGNIVFLSYFKYMNFLLQIANDTVGTSFVVDQILLPLGISFITFQKIAFLVDVYTGRVSSFTFRSYCLFVFFFPQLIAGPIVHYREMMPQFDKATGRVMAEDLAVGFGLFFFGLFKKVILADGIAPYVSPIFTAAANGEPTTLIYAWIATIGFTLQVYFDFSGYSEMALGAARCFGIRLPMNFNSPLKATSIIDFWTRWHITLVRFLTVYVFNPMAFALSRQRSQAGLRGIVGSKTSLAAFASVLVLPTMITMFLSGLWHGAGYGYIVWGVLHGSYLVINHAWHIYRPRFWPNNQSHDRIMSPIGFILTFGAVVLAMAFFRASSIDAGLTLMRGMLGLNGVSLPNAVGIQLGEWMPAGVALVWSSGKGFIHSIAWIVFLLAVAWLVPNTLEIFRKFRPALDFKSPPEPSRSADVKGALNSARRLPAWRLSTSWAIGTAVVATIGILALGQPTEFLYWQF